MPQTRIGKDSERAAGQFPRNLSVDPTRGPKWSQRPPPNAQKINAKTGGPHKLKQFLLMSLVVPPPPTCAKCAFWRPPTMTMPTLPKDRANTGPRQHQNWETSKLASVTGNWEIGRKEGYTYVYMYIYRRSSNGAFADRWLSQCRVSSFRTALS
jgi:hypothetical protein